MAKQVLLHRGEGFHYKEIRECAHIYRSIGLGLEGTGSHRCSPEGRVAGCLRHQQN